MGESAVLFAIPPKQADFMGKLPSFWASQHSSDLQNPDHSVQGGSAPSNSQHGGHKSSSDLGEEPYPSSQNHTPRLFRAEMPSGVPPANALPSRPGGCVHETALIRGRRRMPYSLGIEKLEKISPENIKTRLTKSEEKKLSAALGYLYNNLLPTDIVSQTQKKFVQKLETILNDEWPGRGIRVHVFGSLGNFLSSDHSEVDICVTTDWKELENVCIIAELLAKRGMDKVVCVPAKVPIVKFRDPDLDLACHINVNNTLALETTRMIRTYVSIDERVRPLAMVVKYWARRRMLNDAAFGGTLSSYTWICMIIGFLQLQEPPVVPALHQMTHEKRYTAGDRRSEFADNLENLRDFGEKNTQTTGELLFSFFKFYAHEFNYSDDTISVRLGTVIPKTAKWRRTVNNLLCVEEPFQTSRNLANSADDISHRGLHIEIRRAFDLISEAKLDECCEQYVFPMEEEKTFQRPLFRLESRPTLIRGSSQRAGRGGSRSRPWSISNKNSRRTSSSIMTIGNPVYLPSSNQLDGNWPNQQSQLPLDPATLMSTLEALQLQEQQLRYQLYEHSQSYAQQQALNYVADTGVPSLAPWGASSFQYDWFNMPPSNVPPQANNMPPQPSSWASPPGMDQSFLGPHTQQTTPTTQVSGIQSPQEQGSMHAVGPQVLPPRERSQNPHISNLNPGHDLGKGISGTLASMSLQANDTPIPNFVITETSDGEVAQEAASASIDPSYDNTHHTISSLKTKSTDITMPSSATQSTSQNPKRNVEHPDVVTALSQINEEEPVAPLGSEGEDHPTNDYEDTVCAASTISADSMQLTSAQKVNIVRRFSGMLSGRLAGLLFVDVTPAYSNFGFLRQLEGHLKDFSNTVRSQTSDRAKNLGCKSIRILRREIARELESMLSSEVPAPEVTRHLPYIASEAERFFSGQMTFSEKCHSWVQSEMQLQDIFRGHTSVSDAWDHHLNRVDGDIINVAERASMDAISVSNSVDTSSLDQPGLYPDFINDGNISAYLANHTAFDQLVANVQRSIEKYHCNRMDLIKHHLLDALRRRQINADGSGGSFSATFYIDWDIREFLNTQYPAGTDQDLGLSLVFVGHLIDAQLTIIEDYFARVWPKYATAVLKPLARRMRSRDVSSEEHCSTEDTVVLGVDETTVTATGCEEFIISVAQQLSWLAAACRTSDSGLVFSHVNFQESREHENLEPTFRIGVELEAPASSEQTGCWNSLAGCSVLVTGFPIPERQNAERGLESHLGILSSLLGIRQAVTFRGGYVLKGRYHALVPVAKKSAAVQWHLVDSTPKKLTWTDIDKACPQRVLGTDYKDLKALQLAKTFLGWCPKVKSLLGTKEFDYTAVRHSKAAISSSTRLSLSEFSFGVNKIVSASVKFTLGKKDGIYERDRSDYYEGVLDDAKDTHVFLYDAKHRCAFHTDAERVILHIILHAHTKCPFTIDGKAVSLGHLTDKLDGHAVRQVMLKNADIAIKQEIRPRESEPVTMLFRDKVLQLYDVIHGFQGHGSTNNITLPMESSTTVIGWEYMDLVADKRSMKIKEAKLLKTCGNWPSFAADADINGVILLGQDFGDVLQPVDRTSLCESYSLMPKGRDYLGVQTSTLAALYDEIGSSEDQEQLTSSGVAWHCPSFLFGPCQTLDPGSGTCCCNRVQEFILPRNRFDPRQLLQPKLRQPGPLEHDGAVIFGSSGIKTTMVKRFSMISKKAMFDREHGFFHQAISNRDEFESIEEDTAEAKGLDDIWTRDIIGTHGSASDHLSPWHNNLPETAASSCASQGSTCTDSTISNSTVFSTNGLDSGGQDSNSTSIPEGSEQTLKSATSFTRPGVSFAAAASLPPNHWGKRLAENDLESLPSISPDNIAMRSSFQKQMSPEDGLLLSQKAAQLAAASRRALVQQATSEYERHNKPTARTRDTLQAIDPPKSQVWKTTTSFTPSRDKTAGGVSRRDTVVSSPRAFAPNISYLTSPTPVGGSYQQTLRRKRNFIRQAV